MNRSKFISLLAKEAKAKGLDFRVSKKRGKGSHYTLFCGTKRTIIKSGDLSPLYEKRIREQLGL